MTYLIQKSIIVKALCICLAVLTMACSSYKLDINPNDRSIKYSRTHERLISPAGIILPAHNYICNPISIYQKYIAEKDIEHPDISPPEQPLALLPGSSSDYQDGTATIHFQNNSEICHVWLHILDIFKRKGYVIISSQDVEYELLTDLVNWFRPDDHHLYSANYKVKLITDNNQISLVVMLLVLKKDNIQVNTPSLLQRYTVAMLNSITSSLADQRS